MEDKTFENLEPVRVQELDEILGKPFKVLDDGFVRVVDYMGSDQSVVQAARVSYGKGTKKVREDRGLIRYLMRHCHTTPFEMCEIKFHVRVPMDCWRQWIRHRTANVNEYSTRYSIAINATLTTKPDEWRIQSKSNRQGSEGYLDPKLGSKFSDEELELQNLSRKIYDKRIEHGIAREQARKDLLLSTYTEAYWKVNLHNLLHFLELRMDSHAQLEIRNYAQVIGNEIVKRWVPFTWEAFNDYAINAVSFSKLELAVMSCLANGEQDKAMKMADEFGWLNKRDDGSLKQNLERMEFEEKLERINLKVPW